MIWRTGWSYPTIPVRLSLPYQCCQQRVSDRSFFSTHYSSPYRLDPYSYSSSAPNATTRRRNRPPTSSGNISSTSLGAPQSLSTNPGLLRLSLSHQLLNARSQAGAPKPAQRTTKKTQKLVIFPTGVGGDNASIGGGLLGNDILMGMQHPQHPEHIMSQTMAPPISQSPTSGTTGYESSAPAVNGAGARSLEPKQNGCRKI
jgi:hypothetical protein